jgi:RHS repeat-associated protein
MQKGWKLGGSSTIDSLAYTYFSTSNKLEKVTDGTNDANTKLGDFHDGSNGSSDDYAYDGNGNLTIDNNKAIGNIHYNLLNLPDSIIVTGKGKIKYTYDAAGNKLAKTVIDDSLSKTTITTYINGFEYQNDTLQFFSHEEGRIRKKDSIFVFDYFVKDHLGNVRMMLTDQQQTDAYPAATMETAAYANEMAYYSHIEDTRETLPAGYPNDSYTNPNDYISLVKTGTVGPGIVLKVMAGDKFNLRVSSWYDDSNKPQQNTESMTDAVLQDLSNGIGGILGGHPSATDLQGSPTLLGAVSSFLTTQGNGDTTRPKAFVNWILLDEHFNYVSSSSGFEQVGGDSRDVTVHTRTNMPIDKSGYLYIFVDNDNKSPEDIYFDNLQVTHIRGPLLSEDNYYPFGLAQAGLSSMALNFGDPENKRNKFQNQEFDDALGIDYYEFRYRDHDVQTGRFIQIDPLSDKYVYNSTYAFSEDKVTSHIELEGLESIPLFLGTTPPIANTIVETNNIVPKPAIEYLIKLSEESQSTKLSPKTIENLNRGRMTEAEQLAKNGLTKNNKPIEAIDPKTGEKGTSIPDATKNDGKSTVEIKNTKSQSLTRQLRIQEKSSNDNGFNPELIINQGARLSKPLQNSSFDIKLYNTLPAIDNTGHKPASPVYHLHIIKKVFTRRIDSSYS